MLLKFFFALFQLLSLVRGDCKVCKDLKHSEGYLDSGEPPVVVSFELETFQGHATDFFVYVDLYHTWLADLHMFVNHSGITKYFFDHDCGGNDDLRAYFHDDGVEDVCYDYYEHSYYESYDAHPTEEFGDFNTIPKTGIWNVTVEDMYSWDDGYLNQVCIGWYGDCAIEATKNFHSKDCNHVSRAGVIYALDKCQLDGADSHSFKYKCTSDGTKVEYEEYASLADCVDNKDMISSEVLGPDHEDEIRSIKCDGELADACDVVVKGYDLSDATNSFLDDTCVADITAKTPNQLSSLPLISVRNAVCGVCVDVIPEFDPNDQFNFSSYAYACDWYESGRMDIHTWPVIMCSGLQMRRDLDAGCFKGPVTNPPRALQRIDDGANGAQSQDSAEYYTFNCSEAADMFKPTTAAPTVVPTTPEPTEPICSHIQTQSHGFETTWATPVQTCFWMNSKNAFVRFLCPEYSWFYNYSHPRTTAGPNSYEIWVYGANDVYCNDLNHKETVDTALSVVCTNYLCPQDDVVIATATVDECPISDLNDLRVASDDYKEQPVLVDFCMWEFNTQSFWKATYKDKDNKKSLETVRYDSREDCWNNVNPNSDKVERVAVCADNKFVDIFKGDRRPMQHNQELVIWYEMCEDSIRDNELSDDKPIVRVGFDIPEFYGMYNDELELYLYIDVTHSYLGDLAIEVEHRGVFRKLMSNQCRWLADLRAYFFDSAPSPLENEGCEEHFYGNRWYDDEYWWNNSYSRHNYDLKYNVSAYDSLQAYANEPRDGEWQVTFEDQAYGDEGLVHEVCIGWFGPVHTTSTSEEPEPTKGDGGGKDSDTEVSGIMIGVIVCVVLGICAVAGGLLWLKKKREREAVPVEEVPDVAALPPSQRRQKYVQFTDMHT